MYFFYSLSTLAIYMTLLQIGSSQCHGQLPRGRPYFAWEWGYARTGHISALESVHFLDLQSLCSSPDMRWAYIWVVHYCISHCPNWHSPSNYVPVERHMSLLVRYYSLWATIRHTEWQNLNCHPMFTESDFIWPTWLQVYRQDYPTLASLCLENRRHFFDRTSPFGLGCKCVRDREPLDCPRDNARWQVPEGEAGPVSLPAAQDYGTRIAPGELLAYLEIQRLFIPRCESRCWCFTKSKDEEIKKLAEVVDELNKSFPGWFTDSGASLLANTEEDPDIRMGARLMGCTTNAQCSSGERCRVLPVASSVVLGLSKNTVFQAACMAIAQGIGNRKHTRLDGRDTVQAEDMENGDLGADQKDWPCACNVTYLSLACCDAYHGLVFEAPDLKKGTLLREEDL